MLFTVLQRLGILEDTQNFLLNQLGFINNNLGPFKMRDGGCLIFHLRTSPVIPMATHFDYSEAASTLLDAIGKSTLQNTQEGSSQILPTFSERLLLTVLELDIPLRSFLFEALNKRNAIEVRSLLHPLFNDIRPTIKPSRGLFQQLILEKSEITQRAIGLIQQGMSVPEAAEKLEINQIDFQGWFDEYPQKRKSTSKKQQQSYTQQSYTVYDQEKREAIIQDTIKLFQEEEDMTVAEAARRLNVNRTTLQQWVQRHEQKHGPIPGRKQKAQSHSEKNRNK